MPQTRTPLRVAPLHRRFLAGLIDVLCVLLPLGALIAAVALVATRRSHQRAGVRPGFPDFEPSAGEQEDDEGEEEEDEEEEEDDGAGFEFGGEPDPGGAPADRSLLADPRVSAALAWRPPGWLVRCLKVGSLLLNLRLAVLRRERPSIGQRVMHLRRADVRTGGSVSARSAVMHRAAQGALSRLIRPITRRPAERVRTGPDAHRARSCLLPLVAVAVPNAPVFGQHHQTLAQRVAGIAVVDAR